MTRSPKRRRSQAATGAARREPRHDPAAACQAAAEAACAGRHDEARQHYAAILAACDDPRWTGQVHNDLAVLDAVAGDVTAAREGFARACRLAPDLATATANLALLEEDDPGPAPSRDEPNAARPDAPPRTKVAVLSFLFNWPSTAGGIIHTVELCTFLQRAGYDVLHVFARHEPFGVGRLEQELPYPHRPLEFHRDEWQAVAIQARFRQAVQAFDPDHVLITDTWNFKPLLAEAVRDYPYILRQQALECLCPLNNLRLLVDEQGVAQQCPHNQLDDPQACRDCLLVRGRRSGGLHQAERALAGVGSDPYDQRLRRALQEAEAVLVLNPTVADLLRPHAPQVQVVTWGMDGKRFPWPWTEEPPRASPRTVLFMAGLIDEYIKGFHILQDALARLWARRQDFLLLATGEPAGEVSAFTRFTGWVSQDLLPRHLRAADLVVMPTIAQEGLGRSTVEAMAVGRPVVASRIGGLPYTVEDNVTGLLCEPGDAADLAQKIERLLDDPALRARMGAEARRIFEERFAWESVIERYYRPILDRRRAPAA
jgi:glycosyltransferase involved in cell wall biosynthesis